MIVLEALGELVEVFGSSNIGQKCRQKQELLCLLAFWSLPGSREFLSFFPRNAPGWLWGMLPEASCARLSSSIIRESVI